MMRNRFEKLVVVSFVAASLLLFGCGSDSSRAADGSVAAASSETAITSAPVTQAIGAPTTVAPTPAPAPAANPGLVGNWYGAQADNLAPTCQGSTTYTFSAGGQFTASTIYDPFSPGNCVNFSVSGTWSVAGGLLALSGRPNSPVGQPFTVSVPYGQIDANTITIEGRLYHRT